MNELRKRAAYLRKGHPHALHAFDRSLIWEPGVGFVESHMLTDDGYHMASVVKRRMTWREVLRQIKNGFWR